MKNNCDNCGDTLAEGQIGLCDDCQPRYNVFHRTFWKEATRGGWPNNLEPEKGEKHVIAENVTLSEAQDLCREYNSTHDRGRYSDKAEFERA